MSRPALRSLVSALGCLLAASGLFPALASAFAGQLDPSFGSGGFTILDEPVLKGEFLSDVIVLPDGKILGAGARGGSSGFLLARLTGDGKPDLSFGEGGMRVEPDVGMEGDPRRIESLQLSGDGKIVAAGLGRGPEGHRAFEFARYLPNGELDPGFGTNGLTMVPGAEGVAHALDQAPDGKLVAAGNNSPGGQAVVVRLTEDGEPDSIFSAVPKGVRVVDVPDSEAEEVDAVKVLSNGTVLIGGAADPGAFLAELNKEGGPVLGFGTAGIAVHDTGTWVVPTGEISDIKVLPDGRILTAGSAQAGSADHLSFVARFKQNGELDPTFAEGGVFRSNPTPEKDETESLEVLPDGRIIVAGLRGETMGSGGDTWLYRLTPEGQLDPTFGTGGEAFASAVPGTDEAFGLALQPDGRAVVAGGAETPEGEELLFGRFLGDSTPGSITGAGRPKGRRCGGRRATIIGSEKADRIGGTKEADVIVALGGNDRINGGGGNDVICAGGGKDLVMGGKGRDRLIGGAGKDRLLGGPGKDLCDGGPGKDVAAGSCERAKSAS